ncbi:MAG: acyl carrier protein phosphodiesterase [Candidatus Latescibacterota bacterium]|jgi:acyl carrier protein phosphodiesterase
MNFLAHIYLSGENEGVTIGNFIADSIKGKTYEKYPPDIKKGILLHRAIDSYTDSHKIVRQSTKKLHKNHGHYSGVIVDILYDHYLAKNWKLYHDQPLDLYVASFYEMLKINHQILPVRIKRMMPYMISDNWLLSYATVPGISRILDQMSVRVKGKSNMNFAIIELEQYYLEFETEFMAFFEELRLYAKNKLREL